LFTLCLTKFRVETPGFRSH